MTTQTKLFWTQTPLNAVNELMDQTFSYAQEADKDLVEMYMEDLNDFKKAVTLFRNSDAEALAEHISEMDTSSREQLVLAFAKDVGPSFVRATLGWDVYV